MTKEQISILKDFLPINSSFILKNDEIGVLSPDKSICLFYTPSDDDFTDFKTPCPIYSVDHFIALVETLGVESSIAIKDNVVQIKNGNKVIKYLLSTESVVPSIPNSIEAKFETLSKDIVFKLNKSDLEQIKKISSLLGLEEVKIESKKGKANIIVGSGDTKSSNNYVITVESEGDAETYFSTESLGKLSSGDYGIQVSTVGMSKFESLSQTGLRYYVTSIAK